MKLVKLNSYKQRYLIDKYKKHFKMTWKDLGDKFGFSFSGMRVNFWQKCRPMPFEMFDELSDILSKGERCRIKENAKIFEGKIIRRHIKNRDSKSSIKTMRKRYGNDFFKHLGKIGGKRQKFFWTKEKLLGQSIHGVEGGRKRVKGKLFDEREKILSEENDRLGLIYQNNYFINKELNFDFVYFYKNTIVCVEETTLDPFRGLTYFLEKRKKLDRKIPFVITYDKLRPDVISFLLSKGILPIELKVRNKFLPDIVNNLIDIKTLRKTIKNNISSYVNFWKSFSKYNSLNELRKRFNDSELLLHRTLEEAGVNPLGRMLIETNSGFNYVTDNHINLRGKNIAIITSTCNSRGSLLYTFYKHASFGVLFKNVVKVPVKVFSVIFDYSNTLTSEGQGKPKMLWDNNCDYKIIVNKDNLKDLKNKINAVLGPLA